jgi:superfamily I DNA and RNA helicase
MVAEGKRLTPSDVLKAIKEINIRLESSLIFERWNAIAGTQILKEEADEAKKKKFEDVIDDLRKNFKPDELSDDDILGVIIALDDLEAIEIK